RVSLSRACCPGICSVDQAGLELRDLPASDSRVLGLKVCATIICSEGHLFLQLRAEDTQPLCSRCPLRPPVEASHPAGEQCFAQKSSKSPAPPQCCFMGICTTVN
ncbi:hypothetical protein LEMLEM_LOCUS26350, partial [Lemmus lemmus]